MTADQLKKQWKNASEYAAKYGKSEPHIRGSVGRLHRVEVRTEICHQNAPSAPNYWSDELFDAALAQVIHQRFPELALLALAVMEGDYKAALVAEKGKLLARLAEIQAIEEAQ